MQVHLKQQGSKNHKAKLTESRVRGIRLLYTAKVVTQRELATAHHVSLKTIWKIIHRHTWRHCA